MISSPTPNRGWPWYTELPAPGAADALRPRISIVTPSYNQAPFIEQTLRSVVAQRYPNLEYVVMEDGSTDGSPEIIDRYRPWLSEVVAAPNRGFGAVLHDGLSRCTGEIMAWINSDDWYLPGVFDTVAEIFATFPDVDWIAGLSMLARSDGKIFAVSGLPAYSRRLFFSGRYLGGHPAWNGGWIPQESVFWRRRLWERAGSRFIKERLQYGDFELWSRFWKHSDLHSLEIPMGVYRMHPATYTSRQGEASTAPCKRLIESAAEPILSPGAIRWRERLSRLGGRATRALGQPAKRIRMNRASGRWGVVEERVI
jgi:hypothetical protein